MDDIEGCDQLFQTLVLRKPPEVHKARDVLGAGDTCKLLRIDTVLDERHTITGDAPKQGFVVGAAREDAAVPAERAARDRMEVSLLQPASERRVEEAAMRRQDKRAPVQRLR